MGKILPYDDEYDLLSKIFICGIAREMNRNPIFKLTKVLNQRAEEITISLNTTLFELHYVNYRHAMKQEANEIFSESVLLHALLATTSWPLGFWALLYKMHPPVQK